jgi:hypothetical protein
MINFTITEGPRFQCRLMLAIGFTGKYNAIHVGRMGGWNKNYSMSQDGRPILDSIVNRETFGDQDGLIG